ncbi:MAG TPA: CHASE3 domain-containing protein [Candidatus Binatia bacterium]|nr:CHASE3 domain-containing protein [Candidatus Binatia bacterium]
MATRVGLGLAVVLLLAAGLGAFVEAQQSHLAGDWALHTLKVLGQVRVLLGDLTEAESGQRGFLLTGTDAYLAPYQRGVKAIPGDVARLRELTRDNPTQHARVAALAPLVSQRLDELREAVELRRSQGDGPALDVARDDRGKQTMDQLRTALGEFQDEENQLLKERLAERARRNGRTLKLIGATAAGAVLVGGLSLVGREEDARRRRRAETARRESEERLGTVLRSIGDAVIATDVAGRVVFMNPVAEALTGWLEAAAHGRALEDVFRIVNEETRAPVENPVARVLRSGAVVGLANHTILLARNGREIPIDDSGAPIRDPARGVLGVVLVFRDVSARKQAETEHARLVRAQAAREEAEAANRAKDEFLALLSHELRSPLSAIMGWVALVKRRLLDTAQLERAVDIIERNARQQVLLIDDILDVSRIRAGTMALVHEAVDLGAVVQSCVESIRPLALAKRVDVTLSLTPLPGYVRGDGRRLRQALGNVATNALKFTPSGGRIDIIMTTEGATAIIAVADTGIGIDAEFLPHVFERCRQADTSSARTNGGLGLGLYIVKHLVELHGGSVEAESAGKGRGARFVLRLPLQPTALLLPAGRPQLREGNDHDLRGMTILVVEDDADTREAAYLALESSGARVHAARSARQALELLARTRPDAIVSDVGLPGEDGYALMARVRRDAPDIVAVALTGFASPTDRTRSAEAGFDEHLVKPVDPDRLIQTLAEVLRRRGGALAT